MVHITITEEIRSAFLDLSRPLELCDEDGYLFGRIVPVSPEPNGEPGESPTNGEAQ